MKFMERQLLLLCKIKIYLNLAYKLLIISLLLFKKRFKFPLNPSFGSFDLKIMV